MALVVVGGAISVFTTADDNPTFFTAGPDEPWELRNSRCESPDESRYLFDQSIGSERKTIILCFEAASTGKIPYAVAPEPEEAARERKAQEGRQAAEDRAEEAKTAGGVASPPIIRTTVLPKWYYIGDAYLEPARSYLDGRENSFRITPEMAREVRANSTSRAWTARSRALTDAMPWVFGIIAFFWIVTAIIGWIVRGFAGVPMGSDFRNPRS
jgi:hypothetical protein